MYIHEPSITQLKRDLAGFVQQSIRASE
jgi:hypothetical protein